MSDKPTLVEVVAFLCGEAPLRGVYFGEKAPGERGMYWWRKDLRDALAAEQAQPVQWKVVTWDSSTTRTFLTKPEAQDYLTMNGDSDDWYIEPVYAAAPPPAPVAQPAAQQTQGEAAITRLHHAVESMLPAMCVEFFRTNPGDNWQLSHEGAALLRAAYIELQAAYADMKAELAEQQAQGNWVNADDMDRLALELDKAMHGAFAADRPKMCDVIPDAIRLIAGLRETIAEMKTAQQTAVPLTDKQLREMATELANSVGASLFTMARAVERAHGIGKEIGDGR